jgi:hypothetical protein
VFFLKPPQVGGVFRVLSIFASQGRAGLFMTPVMKDLSTNCVHRLLGRCALLFAFLLIGCFTLLPQVQAVSPPPDGAYPGGNTAEGQAALLSLTSGGFNTAVGFLSLRSNTTGSFNTANGAGTLLANAADENTATGAGALLSNTTGSFNTANGAFALFSNTTGPFNTAMGQGALYGNTTGDRNTAMGDGALLINVTGAQNTAVGVSALRNSNGFGNIAIGQDALLNNTSGGFNTAIGLGALGNNGTGGGNTALGIAAGSGVTTATNVICIGVAGADVSNSCFIGEIRGVTTVNNDAIPVVIDSAGQLGTMSSSRRYKKEIKPIDKASEAILALKPVTFHYKSDKTDRPEFGLIAEEVAEVNPDLVVRDDNGEIYTVRYDAVNAMLLNEFLKEHRKVEQLTKDFESKVAQQQKQIEALTAGLQKVSAQLTAASPSRGGLELSKSAPQTVRLPAVASREGGNNR